MNQNRVERYFLTRPPAEEITRYGDLAYINKEWRDQIMASCDKEALKDALEFVESRKSAMEILRRPGWLW